MPDPTSRPVLQRNLNLYGRHQVASRLLFWFPTSILYFLSKVELGTTLRLGAVYFLSVVILEVPSGWLSDRLGRVPLLRIAAVAWVGAYSAFLVAGSSVGILVAAQFLVALGFAAMSGTDSSFHFDTLEALGQSDEFEKLEARTARNAFLGTTVAAVIGGALGLIDLRLPFAASLVAALYQLTLAMRMAEPVFHQRGLTAFDPTRPRQIRSSLGYLRRPGLAWLFLFLTVQQPLESLAFDLIQPWLAELTGASLADSGIAPLYSGLLVAAISLVGAASAARSHQLRLRFGLRGALGILASIEALILVGMALAISPWLVPLLALRSTQAAAAPVLVASAAAPLIARHHRATFLSLGSLSGRLAYGLALLGLGLVNDLDRVLSIGAALGVASVIVLFLGSLVAGRDDLTSN